MRNPCRWVAITAVILSTLTTAQARPRGGPGHGPPGPIADVGGLMRAADADDDRTVTAGEWAAFLDGLSADGNGAIDLDDLASKLMPLPFGWPSDDAVRDAQFVRIFDVDRDGVVTKEDLAAIYDRVSGRPPAGNPGAGPDRPDVPRGCRPRGPAMALLKAADADDSGEVSSGEWAAFLDGLQADESGAVDLDALLSALPVPPEGWPEDEALVEEMLLRAFDDDGDGVITVTDLEALFGRFDRDGDGSAGPRELKPPKCPRGRLLGAGLALAFAADADADGAVTAEEWPAFLDTIEVDESGAISFDDLAALLPAPRRGWPLDTGKRDAMLTKLLDGDDDGAVTKADLQAIFDALDRNADGALDGNDRPAGR